MSQLIVRLLGPPVVEWDGCILPVPRRKVRALFFRLALDMQPVARDHLAFLLWCNVCDTVGHRSLSHLITHLRNALPDPDLLQSTTDFLFLDSRRIWCDTAAFLQLLRRHHAEPATTTLLEAAALVRGELLEGFSLDGCPEFEEWLTIERSVWERRYQAVADALARDSRNSGDNTLLLQHAPSASADALTLSDQMDPEMHRQMIAARLADGDVEGVREVLEACRGLVDMQRFVLADCERSR